MMIDYLINPKHVACTSERKYMLWLTENLDFTPQYVYIVTWHAIQQYKKCTVASVLLTLTCNYTIQKTRCCVFMAKIFMLTHHNFTVYAYCNLGITLDIVHRLGFFKHKVSDSGSLPPRDLEFLIYWCPIGVLCKELDFITELVLIAESYSGSSINIYQTTNHGKFKRRKKKKRLSHS